MLRVRLQLCPLAFIKTEVQEMVEELRHDNDIKLSLLEHVHVLDVADMLLYEATGLTARDRAATEFAPRGLS